jgi:hypothetical protein
VGPLGGASVLAGAGKAWPSWGVATFRLITFTTFRLFCCGMASFSCEISAGCDMFLRMRFSGVVMPSEASLKASSNWPSDAGKVSCDACPGHAVGLINLN